MAKSPAESTIRRVIEHLTETCDLDRYGLHTDDECTHDAEKVEEDHRLPPRTLPVPRRPQLPDHRHRLNRSPLMSRRKPRSPGVMLRGRAAGLHYWDDEVTADGGKARLHRQIRHAEKTAVRREAAAALADRTTT